MKIKQNLYNMFFTIFLLTLCLSEAYGQYSSYNSISIKGDEDLTPAYFVGNVTEIDSGHFPIGKNPTTYILNANDTDFNSTIKHINASYIPVVIDAEYGQIPFNLRSYLNELKTKSFGRNLIIGDTIPTTMNIAHDFGGIDGLLVIANVQTQGRANNNGTWQSPRGDLMITVNFRLKNTKHSSLLKAHSAISMLKAVQATPGGDYSRLPVKYSWPVSLFWSTIDQKVGGVLVEDIKAENLNDGWYSSGCGLRVNSKMLFSVSKMIDVYNDLNDPHDKLDQLNIEPLIARTMNYMEEYLELLEKSPKKFVDLVTDNWINSNQSVKVGINGKVKGMNEEGDLIIEDENGFFAKLNPDPSRINKKLTEKASNFH